MPAHELILIRPGKCRQISDNHLPVLSNDALFRVRACNISGLINKPNSYTSEFKESTVKVVTVESDQPIEQTARDL
jgi:hypothetical protein